MGPKNLFSPSIEVTFPNLEYSLSDIRILDKNFHQRKKTAANHIKENDFTKKSFESKENISSNLSFDTKSVTFSPGKILPEKR
jgi:hypothetical protein